MNYNLEMIGKRIREERVKRGWSQKELGEKLGIVGKQISNYESKPKPGAVLHLPPLETLLKLCEVFNCELGYLLGEPEYYYGTRFQTSVSDYTSLTPDALTSIRKALGKDKGNAGANRYNVRDYTRVLNSFFCASHFQEFIQYLVDLDSSITPIQQRWDEFESKTDIEETIRIVNSHIDYEHDLDAPKLSSIQVNSIQRYNNLMDNEYEAHLQSKIARYELNLAFERLVNELYPRKTF